MTNLEEEPTPPKPTMPELPQQPILQPPKRKLNQKIVSIILIGIVFCSSLGALGYFYWDLSNKYDSLQSEYATLQGVHNQLNANYEGLEQDYHSLDAKYNDLSIQYNNLNEEYQTIFADYDALWNVFNNPLLDKKVPTVEESEQWLSEDKTDEIQYDYPNFICGDFAVMLSQHAKLKNWDMGIVTVYGYDENYESYGHAFNAIITTEGHRYVEPQDDYFWRFKDGLPILENRWNEIGRDRTNIYVEECKIVVRYE